MNAQLTGQIIGLAFLGIALFIVLMYIVCKSIEFVLQYYFSAKLTYMRLLMAEEPPDSFMDMVRAVAKRHADNLASKDL